MREPARWWLKSENSPKMPAAALTTEQKLEIARCIAPGGFRHFLLTWVKIEDQERGIIPWEMWPCHEEVIEALETEKLISILKARQIGLTWLLGAAYPVWLCLFHAGKLAMLFSTRDDEAAEIVRRARVVWEQLPTWMHGPEPEPDNALQLGFGTGSRIIGFPSKKIAGSGYAASYVLSDEHAKQEYAREQYASVRPTIEHGGQYVSNSTAFGGSTFHHTIWTNARKGLNGFKALFFAYDARPGRDQEWWERTHESWTMTGEEIKFFQEYPRTPEEAVQFSVPRFFPVERLQAPSASFCTPLPPLAIKHPVLRRFALVRPSIGTLGVRVYQEPMPGARYVIGADTSQGIGGDHQAALVMDADTGDEVCALHGDWPISTYGMLLFEVAEVYEALVAIEDNNHGHAVILVVQQLQQRRRQSGKPTRSRLYYRKPLVDRLGKQVRAQQPGWHTDERSKAVMFDGLYDAVLGDAMHVATPAVLEEMKTVVQDPATGKIGAERGYHDDLVIALGITWQMVLLTPRAKQRPQVPFGMGQHAAEFGARAAQGMVRRKPVRKKQGEILPVFGERRTTMLAKIGAKAGRGAPAW